MGWTWGERAEIALRAQPALANVPEIVARWPGMKEAIEKERNLLTPTAQPIPAPQDGGGNQPGPQ